MLTPKRLPCLALVLGLSACAGEALNGKDGANGLNGSDGSNGDPGKDGVSTLIDVTDEPPGENCGTGGLRIRSGVDANGNGILEEEEVSSTKYVCNGGDVTDAIGTVLQGSFTVQNTLDLSFVKDVEEVTGNLTINATGLSAVSLPKLKKVGGNLNITSNVGLTTFELPNLASVGAALNVSGLGLGAGSLTNVGAAMTVGFSLNVNQTNLTTFDLNVSSVASSVSFTNNAMLTSLGKVESIPSIGFDPANIQSGLTLNNNKMLASVTLAATKVDGSVIVNLNPALTTFTAASLATSGGLVQVTNNAALTSFAVPALTTAPGVPNTFAALQVSNNPKLATVNFAKIATVGGSVQVNNNPMLTAFALPEVTSIGGSANNNLSVGFDANHALTSIAMPKLASVTKEFAIWSGNAIQSLDFAALKSVPQNFNVQNVPALTTAGFKALESTKEFNVQNTGLMTISGFSGMKTINGTYNVNQNAKLPTTQLCAHFMTIQTSNKCPGVWNNLDDGQQGCNCKP